jgi:hypothetical protein
MLTDAEPTSTILINVPVMYKNKKHKLLIYTNDLESDRNNLMIVPIPNLSHDDDFGLVDVSEKNRKSNYTFRNELVTRFPAIKNQSFRNTLSNSYSAPNSLIVHNIGNYNISVAPDINSLENMVDWSIFSLPHDFEDRKNTLLDKELYPFKCAYVIAQAHTSVKDDGFGIVYPDPGLIIFQLRMKITNSNIHLM